MQAVTVSHQLKPRHYQVDGINYLTRPRVKLSETDDDLTLCRALLSDAPGAGKTFQATEAAKQLCTLATTLSPTHTHYSTCIICPAHLVNQWYDFLVEQYPDDHVVSAEGPNRRDYLINSNGWDWLIISVQSLRARKPKHPTPTYLQLDDDPEPDGAPNAMLHKNDIIALTEQAFIRNHVHVTIIDESHYVKNADAKQSVNVRHLTRPQFVPHCILLTATPVVREADDLWHQLRIIDPITFRSKDRFLNTYCWFGYGSYGPQNVSLRKGATELLEGKPTVDRWGNPVVSSNNGLGWMMGRSYKDIGLELPPIIPPAGSRDALIRLPLPPTTRKAYDDMKNYWYHQIKAGELSISADNAMKVMHVLRAFTNCAEKRAKLIEYLETDPGPFLVGCFYKQAVSLLCKDLKAAGYNPIEITGDVDASIRPQRAKSAHGPKDVVVATIHSISEGVDLSHLNTVLFYEEDYTPGKMYQFMSRVRRHRDNIDPVTGAPRPQFTIDETPINTNDPTVYQGTFSIHFESSPNETPVICRYVHATGTIDERIHAVQSNRAVNIKDLIKVELQS